MSSNPNFDPMTSTKWISIHHDSLLSEFDEWERHSVRIDTLIDCEECHGRGSIRDAYDDGVECEPCCGTGEIELTYEDMFQDYCKEQYDEQLSKDLARVENYHRLMEDLTNAT